MSSHEWSNDNIYESYFCKTMFFLSKILFRSFFLVQVYAKRQIFRKNSCSNIWMGEFSKAFEKSNQKKGVTSSEKELAKHVKNKRFWGLSARKIFSGLLSDRLFTFADEMVKKLSAGFEFLSAGSLRHFLSCECCTINSQTELLKKICSYYKFISCLISSNFNLNT